MRKLLLTYLLLNFVFISWAKAPKQIIYDYSCLNVEEISLAGQWEFYWKQFLTPKDFEKKSELTPLYIPVPANWGKIPKLESSGYGTYRIRLVLPEKNTLYAIKLADIFCAYRLWINDSLYFQYGKPAKNRAEEIPKRGTQIIDFYVTSDTVQIVLQVSSFHHRNGGILKVPVLGTAPHINNKFLAKSISVFFIFGAFIIFAIYLLWLYSYTKRNFDALLLGLTVLLAGIYTLFNDDFLIMQIFPELNWEVVHKINFLTNYLKIFFLFFFFYMLLHRYMYGLFNSLVKFILAIIVLLAIIVIITPTSLFSSTLMIFIVSLIPLSIYVIVGYIRRINYSNNKMYLIPFGSIVLLAIFALNDVLYEYQIINSVYLTDVGLFIFTAAQAILVSEKQIETYNKAERLAKYFQKLNNVKKLLGLVHFDNLLELLKILKKTFNADIVTYYSIEKGKIFINAIIDNKYEKEFSRKVEVKKEGKEANQILYDFLELAMHSQQTFVITDRNKLYRLIKQKLELSFKSILITTIGAKHQPLGIIYIESQHLYFTREDEKLLNLISPQIASIVNNIKIFRHLENLNKNLLTIVKQRTQKIEERNRELELRNFDLDEKIEELRITAEIINSMNEEIKTQQEILQQKNKLLAQQTESLNEQKTIMEELNKQVRESMQYAYRIQYALLNSPYNRPRDKEHFIISKSKEPVSGNFWWYLQLSDYEIFVFGQSEFSGIKGAFISLLAFSLMNEMAYKYLIDKDFVNIDANEVVNIFNSKVKKFIKSVQIELSAIFLQQNKGLIKASTLNNFIYLVNKEFIQLSPFNREPETVKIDENSYFIGFTNNFVKLLLKNKYLVNIQEITTLGENMARLSSLKEIKTFFENHLYDNDEFDILIIGMKLK